MQHVSAITIKTQINVFPSWTASWTSYNPDGSVSTEKPQSFPWRVDGFFELTIRWVGAKRVWSEKRISDLTGMTRYCKKLLDQGYLKDREHATKIFGQLTNDLDSLNCEGLYQLGLKSSVFDVNKRLGLGYSNLMLFELALRAAVLMKYPDIGGTEEGPVTNPTPAVENVPSEWALVPKVAGRNTSGY